MSVSRALIFKYCFGTNTRNKGDPYFIKLLFFIIKVTVSEHLHFGAKNYYKENPLFGAKLSLVY